MLIAQLLFWILAVQISSRLSIDKDTKLLKKFWLLVVLIIAGLSLNFGKPPDANIISELQEIKALIQAGGCGK